MAATVSLATVQAVIRRAIAAGIHDRGRIERAAQMIVLGMVEQTAPTAFTVRSQFCADVAYTVTPDGCTCADATNRPALRCKHDIAARILLSAARDEAAQRQQAAQDRVAADTLALAVAAAHHVAA